MASSPGNPTPLDFQTRVIMVTAVVAGLSCLTAVIIGGFITATSVQEGVQQVPVEAPMPMEDFQVPSRQPQRSAEAVSSAVRLN